MVIMSVCDCIMMPDVLSLHDRHLITKGNRGNRSCARARGQHGGTGKEGRGQEGRYLP